MECSFTPFAFKALMLYAFSIERETLSVIMEWRKMLYALFL